MVVGVIYWEAINYTQEVINYFFFFLAGYLIEKNSVNSGGEGS